MCKTPASGDCQVADEDIPEEEEDVASEESDLSSGHSIMSESSDEEWTDSDAESASGHRVTPSMLMYHLMKQKGLISEERYKEVQKSSVDVDLNKVAPRFIRGFDAESDDDDDSYSFDTGEDDDDDDEDEGSDNHLKSNINDKTGETNETESEANTNTSLKKADDEQNNEIENQVVGDSVASEKLTSNKVLNAVEQVTKSKHLENEFIDKRAQGDGLINNTVNPQKVENLEVKMESKAMDDKTEDKPDTPVATSVVAKDLISEEEVETIHTKPELGNETEVTIDNTVSEESESVCETNGSEGKRTERTVSEDLDTCQTNRFEGKRTESIENILKEMMAENRIQEEHIMVLETYSSDLDKFYKCNYDTKKFGEPNNTLRKFALFLNYYSPSAYNYIRETFVTPLPSYKVLCSWYMKDDDSPGLTKKAFDILKRKASGRKLYCTLMSDPVFLNNFGLNYDQVDFGGGCNYEYTDKAVMAFVLMLVGLDGNWKIPIGYFPAHEVPAETHAALIRICLTQCHEIGVDVVAVTLDAPAPAEHLGCNFDDVRNLKTTFKHPECDRDVAVWIDPCLAIRSIYHTLKSKSLIYFDDMKIRFNMIRRFRQLHSNDYLNYEESHSPSHLELRNHIAKVGLTSAILSDSLRPAISLCEEIFPRNFKNSSATTDFIGAINNLYEILNSKLSLDSGYQRAMDTNSKDVLDILDAAKGYFADIFSHPKNGLSRFDKDNYDQDGVYRSFVDGEQVCGFVIYLICIESLKHLYETLIKTGEVSRLATHRLCKDHIADFIRHMRRNEDMRPDDFTAWAYQSYLSELLEELEKKTRLSDRNVTKYYPIENKCSPVAEIKVTSGKRAYDEDYSYRPKKLPKTCHEERATKIVRGMSVALDTEGDQSSRQYMVAYLAGWIAAKFAKCLKCEECIDCLLSNKKLWFHKFITFKELSGICLPSEELFRVCWECERVLKSGASRPECRVLRGLLPRFPWASRGVHHPSHRALLVRAIVSKYIPLRVPVPLSKKETIRMAQMFSFIKCMQMSGFNQQSGMEDLLT